MRWDPERYLEFAEERGRPFGDLLARIDTADPRLVVDLGCGPGNLTATLVDRWPSARVLGVDSSTEMVQAARAGRGDHSERLSFRHDDLSAWSPEQPVDVLVSNAALQWVPGHLDLLPRLLHAVRPGGWLAFQVPGNFSDPSHTAMTEVAESPRWADVFAGKVVARPAVEAPGAYLERLVALGAAVDCWETTYLHVLTGPDAVVRWVSGTGLRPYLQALDDEHDRAEFLVDYRSIVSRAYPERPWGTVLPFRRILVAARAPGGGRS